MHALDGKAGLLWPISSCMPLSTWPSHGKSASCIHAPLLGPLPLAWPPMQGCPGSSNRPRAGRMSCWFVAMVIVFGSNNPVPGPSSLPSSHLGPPQTGTGRPMHYIPCSHGDSCYYLGFAPTRPCNLHAGYCIPPVQPLAGVGRWPCVFMRMARMGKLAEIGAFVRDLIGTGQDGLGCGAHLPILTSFSRSRVTGV